MITDFSLLFVVRVCLFEGLWLQHIKVIKAERIYFEKEINKFYKKMQFKEGTPLYSYEVQREGGEDVLYINYLGAPYVPSLSDYPEVMERTIDALIENPNVSRIVFVQQKNYNYDFKETSMLLELANLYVFLLKQEKILSHSKLVTNCEEFFSQRYNDLFAFLFLLKQDPIAAYHELKRLIIEAKVFLGKINESCKTDQQNYISLLEKILNLFDKTELIIGILLYAGVIIRDPQIVQAASSAIQQEEVTEKS